MRTVRLPRGVHHAQHLRAAHVAVGVLRRRLLPLLVADSSLRIAGDGDVTVTAGDVGGQALAAGLVDEVEIDLAPVVLGRGKRFFGADAPEVVLGDPYLVVPSRRVTHLRYRVGS